MQQMAQQMAMQMQAARWGYPLVYDPRPGWYYGPWVPMPTLPQPEVKRPRERGYTGIDREEFDPPSKDAYQVPKDLSGEGHGVSERRGSVPVQKGGGEIFQRVDGMRLRTSIFIIHLLSFSVRSFPVSRVRLFRRRSSNPLADEVGTLGS